MSHPRSCPCWDCGYPGMKRRYPRSASENVLLADGTWTPAAPLYHPTLLERVARWWAQASEEKG